MALGRELLGGNGILTDFHVGKVWLTHFSRPLDSRIRQIITETTHFFLDICQKIPMNFQIIY